MSFLSYFSVLFQISFRTHVHVLMYSVVHVYASSFFLSGIISLAHAVPLRILRALFVDTLSIFFFALLHHGAFNSYLSNIWNNNSCNVDLLFYCMLCVCFHHFFPFYALIEKPLNKYLIPITCYFVSKCSKSSFMNFVMSCMSFLRSSSDTPVP